MQEKLEKDRKRESRKRKKPVKNALAALLILCATGDNPLMKSQHWSGTQAPGKETDIHIPVPRSHWGCLSEGEQSPLSWLFRKKSAKGSSAGSRRLARVH